MYITLIEFLISIGKSELAMLCGGRLDVIVDADVLDVVINEGDTSAFSAEQIEYAQSAKSVIEQKITASSYLMSGYIKNRHQLPLSAELIAGSPLPNICEKLAKYELMLNADEQTTKDNDAAMRQLRDIANGLLSLGESDSTSSPRSSQARAVCYRRPSITDGY
jgi:phage gp36-like protein